MLGCLSSRSLSEDALGLPCRDVCGLEPVIFRPMLLRSTSPDLFHGGKVNRLSAAFQRSEGLGGSTRQGPTHRRFPASTAHIALLPFVPTTTEIGRFIMTLSMGHRIPSHSARMHGLTTLRSQPTTHKSWLSKNFAKHSSCWSVARGAGPRRQHRSATNRDFWPPPVPPTLPCGCLFIAFSAGISR